MIPVELQASLKKRVQDLFITKTFNDPDMEQVSLHVFEQHLPQKDQNDISYYPYVLVQIENGEQLSKNDPETAKIIFVIGIFDEDPNNQGHNEVVRIINKILFDLKKNPQQNLKFELQYPIRWALHDEDVAPYYFGAIETTWSVLEIFRDDVEGLI